MKICDAVLEKEGYFPLDNVNSMGIRQAETGVGWIGLYQAQCRRMGTDHLSDVYATGHLTRVNLSGGYYDAAN